MQSKFFVVPRGDSWAVRREGAREDLSTHFSRDEAISAGREICSREDGELIVHNAERRKTERLQLQS